MVVTKTLLLLVGVFFTSTKALVEVENYSTHGRLFPFGIERPVENFFENARSGSPYIQNYVQKGSNVFYKPQFSMASQPGPIMIGNKDCDKPLVPIYPQVIDEPVKIIETDLPNNHMGGVHHVIEVIPGPEPMLPMPAPGPVVIEEPMVIPELPNLPPLMLPELPMPAVPVQDEMIVETPIIPEAPFLPPMPEPVPVMIEEPVMIPELPILPPFMMPELPVPVVMPEEPIPAIVEVPEIIPEGPVLPPLIMPEMPVLVEVNPPHIPELPIAPMPIMPPVLLPEPILPEIVEPVPMPIPTIIEEPVFIPEAPVLPPLEMPALPEPVLIEEHIMVHNEPPVPMLPLEFPPFPVLVETVQDPCPEPVVPLPMPIPSPPEYPMFVMPNMPAPASYQPALPMMPFMPAIGANFPMMQEKIEIDKFVMSSFPIALSFPTSCVQEIVVERVLPNIAGETKVVVPATYPVTSGLTTLGMF